MPLRNWTYYYSLPPSATETEITDISPANADLLFDDTKERDQIFHRKACRTEFTLFGSGYDIIKALFDTDPCDEVLFHMRYNNVEKWKGSMNLKKAKHFPDNCQIKFTPDISDDNTCIYENWEDDKNIFNFGSEVVAETFFGTITQLTCGPVNEATSIEINGYYELNVNGCLGGNDAAYTLLRAYNEEITPGTSYDHYATFVTEQVVTACSGGSPVPPPGDGWVLLIDNCPTDATYGRPVQVNYLGELSATTGKNWDNQYEVVGGKNSEYDNGRLFSSIIEGLLTPCGYTVVSDFFNINPDASAPSNDAYTASAALHTMFVFQKSDIKRPGASNPATIGFLTLRKMLTWLQNMFEVYWRIEGGTDFRLEHISYFEGSNGEDLTSTQAETVNYRNDFTFDNDKLVPRESFRWMDPTNDPDFYGLDIIYPNTCADPDLEPEVTRLDEVFTDLGRVDSLPDSVSDEGFFFMATDLVSGTYYINREMAALSGDIKPNAHLSWGNIHENYLTWGRLQSSGTLNNVSQTFNSYKPSKRQQSLPVQIGVDDYFALDTSDKFNTGLGWGAIDKGTFSAAQCRYNVELLHDD